MTGEWCYFLKHFTADTCKTLIDTGLSIPSGDAVIGAAATVRSEHRRSKVRFMQQQDPRFKPLFAELWELAIMANRDWFNFHFTNLDYLQMAEYADTYKGEYKRHQDVFWVTENPRHRKLSCIVQLSDPTTYKGGDLELYDCEHYPNKEEIRQQGTVIFFPSFVYHAALPITEGTRYSLAAWFEGPKWH